MRKINYLGNTFGVWSREQSWFWSVVDLGRPAIGAAASEAEAIREACAAIDETSIHRQHEADIAAMLLAFDWERSLASLQSYLARVCDARA